MALYACEAIKTPVKQLRGLRASVAKTIYPRHTGRRSQELFYALASDKIREPQLYITIRRIKAISRTLHDGTDHHKQALNIILRSYQQSRVEG